MYILYIYIIGYSVPMSLLEHFVSWYAILIQIRDKPLKYTGPVRLYV